MVLGGVCFLLNINLKVWDLVNTGLRMFSWKILKFSEEMFFRTPVNDWLSNSWVV